jgi:hypothetical protein
MGEQALINSDWFCGHYPVSKSFGRWVIFRKSMHYRDRQTVLRRLCQTAYGLHFLWISQEQFFLERKIISHASNILLGGQGHYICVPQWQGGPVIPPRTRFHFRRLLPPARLRWRYSNPPPHGEENQLLPSPRTFRELIYLIKKFIKIFNFLFNAASLLDSANVDWTYELWVGLTWEESKLPSDCALQKENVSV